VKAAAPSGAKVVAVSSKVFPFALAVAGVLVAVIGVLVLRRK
jgi:hypothetical protein